MPAADSDDPIAHDRGPDQGIDPDIDLGDPVQRAETGWHEFRLVAAIAAGGALGAEGRYGLARAIPHPATAWPWGTLVANAGGSVLIGVLMVVLLEVVTPHRLARPFLGVGVLGGFTTFSTFAGEVEEMLRAHRVLVAGGYALASVLACLAAVALGTTGARALLVARRQARG